MSLKHSVYDVENLFKPLDTDNSCLGTITNHSANFTLKPFLPQSEYLLKPSFAQFCFIAFPNECIPIMNHFELLIIANPAAFSDKEEMISC